MAHATVTETSLSHAPCMAVLCCKNIQKAQEFYGNTLGLVVAEKNEGALRFQTGNGTGLMVYQRDAGPKAENTVAGFSVKNLRQTITELRAKGVAFEEYNMPGMKTVDGIATVGNTQIAWFKDPDGNIIAVDQA